MKKQTGSPSARQTAVAKHRNRILNAHIPDEVLASIHDPDRLSPMLAGASCIDGGRLTVRCPGEDIDVDAPAQLVRFVFDQCDGTRTINEVLDAGEGIVDRSEISDFIAFLLSEGALIDASLICAHTARYAFQFSPFGLAAEPRVTNQICRRFLWNADRPQRGAGPRCVRVDEAPLNSFFESRVSTYTFDEVPIPDKALHQLLWSLAGVVRVDHPRVGFVTPQRTIASAGGMHLLEVYVALHKKVGRHLPGVYRVFYPDERVIQLEPINRLQGLLPLAFGKPWELTYATGAIFLAADPVIAAMRYRSRATQYLFMEAGAALHNGGLSAQRLKLGFAPIGGYYEGPVTRLCGLDKQLVLGSAIFGARPTRKQLDMVPRSPDLDFAWVNGESAKFSMPFHLARAKVKTPDDDRPHTWGRGTDAWIAMRKAIGEAVEREGFREPRQIVEGPFSQMENAVHPSRFIRYRQSQYALPDFAYRPFDPEQRYPWTTGTGCSDGGRVHVLAELVFSRASLAAHGHATPRPFTQVTSSGCAAGTSLADAMRRAILEVVERDAFMSRWLSQTSGIPIRNPQCPVAVRERVAALEATGCRVSLQQLPSPWAHVALVAAQHPTLHFTTMGTAAGTDLSEALTSALDELEARVYAWIHGHAPSISGPQEVTGTEHHFELYGLKKYFRRADRVLFPLGVMPLTRLPRALASATAQDLIDRFSARDIEPIFVDITPSQCYVDQGRTALSVVKMLIPELLPISFGHQREPLGMVPRIHPGSKFPHPFP